MLFKTAKKINKYFFYGWIVLLTATVATFFSSPGQTYSISAFIGNYITDFGYSRTYMSTIYSGATILSGLLMIFMGKSVDRFGSRNMLIVATVFLALTTFFNSTVVNIPMIFIGFFLLRFWGQGSMTLIPSTLVPQWFEKQRAFALSIVSMGTILGNLLVPIANTYMINNYNWRVAWQVWGVGLIVILLPLVIVTVINKPEDLSLLPDNQKALNKETADLELANIEKTSFTLKEATKTREFWFIGLISMVTPLVTTGMMFHFYSLMGTKNVAETQTAFIIGLMALPGLLSPIVSKVIIDRYSPRIIMLFTLLTIALDLLFMIFVSSVIGAGLFIIIYGFATIIQTISLNVIWVQYFGRKYLGSIRGAATVFAVFGSAFGPVPFGMSFDVAGTYVPAFVIMSIATICALVLAWFIKQPLKTS